MKSSLFRRAQAVTKTWDDFCCLLIVPGLSDLGVEPRILTHIWYFFCKSPAAVVSPGALMVQLKKQCFNQDVHVNI